MKHSRSIAICSSLALLSSLSSGPGYAEVAQSAQTNAQAAPFEVDKTQHESGKILVKFTNDAASSLDRAKQSKAMKEMAEYGEYSVRPLVRANANSQPSFRAFGHSSTPAINRWHVIELPPGLAAEDAMVMFQSDTDVEAVELNYTVSIDATPSDPRYFDLWGMNNTGQTGGTPDADIGAEDAWDVSTGDGSVVVGVLDTGVDYTHEDLAANMWVNPGEVPGNGIDDDNNGYVDDVHGYDFLNDDGDPMDDHGHGTHVSGTIAAVGNNGIGVAGVNWNAKIMALKFINHQGFGTMDKAAEALTYATNMGVRVTNNSWGGHEGEEHSQLLYDAIAAANAANGLFVASAGNSSRSTDDTGHIPASFDLPNIVSVASTDHNDELSWFSNWGPTTVDLAAPGEDIWSTYPTGLCCSSSGYRLNSGTSMAAPHVAGGAALLLSQVPTLTVGELKAWLMDSVDTPPNLAGTSVSQGRLNIANAMWDTDYRLTVSPSPIGIWQGDSDVVTLAISAFNSFDGPLTLSTETSHPSITVNLDSNQVNAQSGDVVEINATISVDASLHANRHSFTIVSTDASGNQKMAEHYVDVIGPDFTLSVAPSSATMQSGDSSNHEVTIDSIEGHIGPISLDVISNDPTVTPALSATLMPLPANGSSETNLTVNTTIATPAGDYQVHIMGADEEVTRSTVLTVNVPPVIDLHTILATTTPSQVGELGRFNIDFNVENLGNTNSDWITWGLYLSTDANVTTSDQVLTEGMIFLELEALASTSTSKEVTLSGDVVAGNYYLGVIVDNSDSAAEQNKANNTASAPVAIVGFDADVKPTSVTSNKASLASGESLTLTATVANQGSNTANSVNVDFYLSQDGNIDAGDFLLGSDSLTLHGVSEGTVSVTAPATVAAGQYHIGVIVDGANAIDESDEGNNVLSDGTVTVADGVDLVVSSVTVPPTAALGENINIDLVIANQGGADLQGSTDWHIYLSTDSTITTADRWLHFGHSTDLAAGESHADSRAKALPTDIAPGQYYIGVIVDRWDAVDESNETNNTGAVAIDITASQ